MTCGRTSSPATFFPTMPCRITRHCPQAQRDPRSGPADPHTRARELLSERTPAASRARRTTIQRSLSPTPRSSRSRPTTTTARRSFAAAVGAQWPFLSDPDRTVQKDLDIQEYTDPRTRPDDPAHLRAQARSRSIHSIYDGYGSGGRPSFYDLWHDLRCRVERDPPRLGSEQAGPPGGVGRRRLLVLSRMGSARRRAAPTSYEL